MFVTLRVTPLLLFAFLAQLARADELRVPETHLTIQAAIDASTAGDTVVVRAGTYTERVVLKANVAYGAIGVSSDRQIGDWASERKGAA